MATVVETKCKCDICGQMSRAWIADKMNYSELWKFLVKYGWNHILHRNKVLDLCPTCYNRHLQDLEKARVKAAKRK